MENYNPRQRKLRNLIVGDENPQITGTPPEGHDAAGEEAQPAVPENPEQSDCGAAKEESFGMDDVMEVLVTDTFPIQSHLVVELQRDGAEEKA